MLWAFIGSFPGYKLDKNHKYYFEIHFSFFLFCLGGVIGTFCPLVEFRTWNVRIYILGKIVRAIDLRLFSESELLMSYFAESTWLTFSFFFKNIVKSQEGLFLSRAIVSPTNIFGNTHCATHALFANVMITSSDKVW